MSDIALYSLAGLMFYQAYVTIRVVRYKPYTSEKKRQQLLLVWLIPLIGAAIALAGLATDGETAARRGKDIAPKKPPGKT